MKVLFVGDIVGKVGRDAIGKLLPQLKKEFAIDFVIANAENAAGGSGVTPRVYKELIGYGIDLISSGDHIWKRRDIFETIDDYPQLLRPSNFPPGVPGRGSAIFKSKNGLKVAVINLLGRVFMQPVDCPFRAAKQEIEQLSKEAQVIIVDIHAEATSEKIALGWYLDGMVSAVLGTHTHVQTADQRILPKGSAYITDAGMTGPIDSVIGRRVEDVLERFLTQVPTRFEIATENIQLQGVIIDIDEKTGKAASIERIQRKI